MPFFIVLLLWVYSWQAKKIDLRYELPYPIVQLNKRISKRKKKKEKRKLTKEKLEIKKEKTNKREIRK